MSFRECLVCALFRLHLEGTFWPKIFFSPVRLDSSAVRWRSICSCAAIGSSAWTMPIPITIQVANERTLPRSAGPAARRTFASSRGTCRDRELLDRLLGQEQFAAIAHLAAMAGVRASVDDPRLYFDVNLLGTLNLLEAAQRHGVGQFVLRLDLVGLRQHERDSVPRDRPV